MLVDVEGAAHFFGIFGWTVQVIQVDVVGLQVVQSGFEIRTDFLRPKFAGFAGDEDAVASSVFGKVIAQALFAVAITPCGVDEVAAAFDIGMDGVVCIGFGYRAIAASADGPCAKTYHGEFKVGFSKNPYFHRDRSS